MKVPIPYYWVDRWGNGYWTPKKHMREAGFANVACGKDGPQARAIAMKWVERWKAYKAGETGDLTIWPDGSVGEGFQRFRRLGEWASKKPRTREDWDRGWAYIRPIFGDRKPSDLTLDDFSLWYHGDPDDPEVRGLLQTVGIREAHRAVKIWRALWQVLAAMKYCEATADPSFGIRRKTPRGRSEIWSFEEVHLLVKRAIRMRYFGLACIIAVAWDTQFSPVDVRTLVGRHRQTVAGRLVFDRGEGRTKTEENAEAVLGTLSRRTERLLRWYFGWRFGDSELHPDAHLFLTRGGAPVSRSGQGGKHGGDRGGGAPHRPRPYSKDRLVKDFAAVRAAEFGPEETRRLMDMRRSGSVEAVAGQVDAGALAAKMGNTIDESRELQKTYLPGQVAVVRQVDEARVIGRRRLLKER